MRTALWAVVLIGAVVAGMPTAAHPPTVSPAWDDLASADASKAYAAIWTLVRTRNDALPRLREKLQPVPAPDPKAVEQLIKDLDNPTFAVRDKATRELERLAEVAGPALHKANVKGLSLETRTRLEKLLGRLTAPFASPEQLRSLRSVEVLELTGSDDARLLLQQLAGGAAEARLTKHAAAAVERLARRPLPAAAKPYPKQDWHGDPLPARAAVRLGTIRFRDARRVAFLPDGKTMLAGNFGSLHLYDVATGQDLAGFPVKDLQFHWHNVVVSTDGSMMAASHGKKVTVRELPSAKPVHTFTVTGDRFEGDWQAVAFSRDGKSITAAGRRSAYSWDLATGKLLKQFVHTGEVHENSLVNAVLSSDGKYLTVRHREDEVQVWDVTIGKVVHRFEGHPRGFFCAAFSPDDKMLATGGFEDRAVQVWDLVTGKPLRSFAVRNRHVADVAFSPDGKHLAASGSAFRADDSSSDAIYCWDLQVKADKPLVIPAAEVWRVEYAPDGKTLAWSNGVAIHLLDAATGKEPNPLPAHGSAVRSVAWSADGTPVATADREPVIRVWDAATGKPLGTLVGHTEGVYAVAFRPDGKALGSCSADGTAVVWDLATAKPTLTVKHDKQAWYCAFSPDLRWLATAGEQWTTLRVWDLHTGKIARELQDREQLNAAPAFSADGSMLAVCRDEVLRVHDRATGKVLHTFAIDCNRPAVAFSPDGRTLAVTTTKGVVLWELLTGAERARIAQPYDGWGCCLAFSPDGHRLAFARRTEEKSLAVWDLATRRDIGPAVGPRHQVLAVAFSPDGRRLATGSEDTTALIWELDLR
jgi:WD40 repeat protein